LAFLITVGIYVALWCCRNLLIPGLEKLKLQRMAKATEHGKEWLEDKKVEVKEAVI
jgi:hypothetical protein